MQCEKVTRVLYFLIIKKWTRMKILFNFGIRHYGTWDTSNEKGKIDYIIRRVLGKKTEWNGWAIWASLFHTEFIKKYKIQFCASCANFAEDLGFVLEYLLFCDSVVCIDSCQYCYVQHSNSMMSNSLNIVKIRFA